MIGPRPKAQSLKPPALLGRDMDLNLNPQQYVITASGLAMIGPVALALIARGLVYIVVMRA